MAKKGNFIMKGYTPELINTYYCEDCKEAGKEHEIIDVPDSPTTSHSHWGAGVPSHKRRCTGCGAEDGPWVKAEHVGGYW